MKFGCTILPLPPYCSNLAYSDYHVFPNLQHHLLGQKLQTRDDIEKDTGALFQGHTICLNVGRRTAMLLGHDSNDSHLSFKNCKRNKNIVNLSENFRLNLILYLEHSDSAT
ncbi:hypothetical protein Y032_0050g2043 [Ancylostoma ceylanicum]|uniref:Uncharacterized protein n=1 Tax=Ancylostoma ceylanicum TaxID=53326 RepID=A0A016U956_9BILA|nr:hypothetical protein Y032_0050g2043 [Ancylostoma ceylanicum]